MSNKYTPTIGLEIHAELHTETKLFCRSKNDPDEKRPNVHICPICMAHPGTLPVINKQAIQHVVRVGTALGGTIADFCEFDRKNYFYPDIPKGYQISQYKYPLVVGGSLAGVAITRVHLEEDTARSIHGKAEGETLVDYNRAGVPLMELVTEPVMHDPLEAGAFARELRTLLRTIGASQADMEKGQMRVEANVSVSSDPSRFGTKVEIKNINSFRAVEQAIAYEITRQSELLEAGGAVVQETRGWNEVKGETFSQRSKEGAHDYRYFPEPDIPKFKLSLDPSLRDAGKNLPELPWVRRERLIKEYGLREESASLLVFDPVLADYFFAVCGLLDASLYVSVSNYLLTDFVPYYNFDKTVIDRVTPASFAEIIRMFKDNALSSRGAKDLLSVLAREGGDPKSVAARDALLQVSDDTALAPIVAQVIRDYAGVVEEYRSGKDASLQFLVGQAMKISRGSANPGALARILTSAIRG